MATARTEAHKIVARARRIEWPVERGNGRQPWLYRITMPNGKRVQIHGSPSDTNWMSTVLRELDSGGFTEAETKWLAEDEERRKASIARNQTKAQEAAERAATRASKLTKAAGPYVPQPADLNWIITPAELPEIRQIVMTPAIAETILVTINTHNRKLREAKVSQLVDIIQSGDWALTHQGGATDTNGVLQDGQHRLAAIAKAGIDVPILWTVGMPPENYYKVDTGTLRGGADVVHARGGLKYQTATAAAAKMIDLYERYGSEVRGLWRGRLLTNAQVERALDRYGDALLDAVARAAKIRLDVKISHTALAAAIYLLRARMPEGDPRVEEFFSDFATGANLTEKDPVFILRRSLIRARSVNQKFEAYQLLGLILKTWRYRMTSQEVNIMRFDRDEKMPAVYIPPPLVDDTSDEDEVFPEVEMADSTA